MTDRERIEVDKTKEMRTKEISRMIDEGGLGADHYYHIIKESVAEQKKESDMITDTKNS